ncbi:SIMPL domain-containing protein [Colibacter massiliensis]|uniref:SIMPL domain-containing protein n=1 Tax=Colibacter massiliensis TaxID=1852379 RepID=UPI002352388E|nr:SIMPL domain-containing protein [Colibacter massiliensis]
MLSRSIRTALLCLCVTSLLAGAPAYAAQAEAPTVSVTGYAEEETTPDTAYITIGMTTTGDSSESARTKNNDIMSRVEQAALSFGIDRKDMKTNGLSIYPNYTKDQKISGYTVSNNLEIKVSDFDILPRLIAKASAIGANQIHGIRFTNEHTDTLRSNLIKKAVYNGRQTAQAAAEATGHQLGSIKSLSVNGTSPVYEANAVGMSLLRTAKAADLTPVEPGTNKLSETVDIVYYLQ